MNYYRQKKNHLLQFLSSAVIPRVPMHYNKLCGCDTNFITFLYKT